MKNPLKTENIQLNMKNKRQNKDRDKTKRNQLNEMTVFITNLFCAK